MFFHTPTKVSAFCLAVFQIIDDMCYALRCLQPTQENKALFDDLRGIKTVLNCENDNDNVTSLFAVFDHLVKKHQQVIALIPIIICLKDTLNTINPISVKINTLCAISQKLNELVENFKQSLKDFKAPTEGEAEKIYKKFMARLKNKIGTKKSGTHEVDTQSQFGWGEQSKAGDVDTQSQFGWQQSQAPAYDASSENKVSLTQEELTILGENIRYRLMALALELNIMSNDTELSNILGLNLSQTCLTYETQLIVCKVSRMGNEWQNLYQQNRLEDIFETLTNWFDSFHVSNRVTNNNFKMIIINLIYDFFLKSQENFQKQRKNIPQLQNYIENMKEPNGNLLQYGNTLLNEIKNKTKFEAIKAKSDGTSNVFTQQKIYLLYSNILSRLPEPAKLIHDFKNIVQLYNEQKTELSEKTPLIPNEEGKCCPCCCIL